MSLSSFFDCIENGDSEGVLEALALNPELATVRDPNRRTTALILAARLGFEGGIDSLIEHGDPDACDDFNRNALMLAARYGHAQWVEALIPKTNLQTVDASGRNALMMAALGGSPDCVRLLLDAEISEKLHDKEGRTALMHAASSEDAQCVEMLLPCNAQDQDHKGVNALMVASGNKDPRLVELLLPWSDPTAVDHNGSTALMCAAGHENGLELLPLLLPHSEAQATNKLGKTALAIAAESGFFEQVEQLLPASDPNIRDNRGLTACEAAIRSVAEGTTSVISDTLLCIELLAPLCQDPSVLKDFLNLSLLTPNDRMYLPHTTTIVERFEMSEHLRCNQRVGTSSNEDSSFGLIVADEKTLAVSNTGPGPKRIRRI